ncbi:MAG: hypothetical protein U0132_24140, partial [Gemmatimonadaceae bacterium]
MILRLIHFSAHAQTPRSDLDLAFVTDDDASINVAGCDSITAIDERTGDHVFDARQTISPGRIAVSSQAKWIASTSSNTGAFIVLLNQLGLNSLRWSTSKIAAPIVLGGPLAFAPNDTWLLVAGRGQVMRYDVSRFSASGLGGISGEFVSADTAAILFTRDSSMAIIVHLNESVEFIDPSTMLRNRPTVQYANPLRQIRYTNAAITPDDRFVLITTGGPDINVIDLVAGSTRVVHPDRLGAGYGISINFRSPDRLVAINARTAVIVYRVDDRGDFVEQSRTSVPPQGDVILSNGYVLRHPNAIAWTSDGSGIIAAIGGPKEFRILDYHPGLSAILSHRLDFNACISDLDQELAIDVVTLNDR